MTKQKILNYFNDINEAYNNCNMHDDLSRMLDELLKEQPQIVRCKDCKHRKEYSCPLVDVFEYCDDEERKEFYCAFGERAET